MSNAPLNIRSLQDQLQSLARREGISKWDLGASRSNSSSVQVDRGEAKQLKAAQRSSITIRVWNQQALVGITSTSDLSNSGLEKALMGAHQASNFGNPDDIPGFSPLATAPQPDLHRPLQDAQGIQSLLNQLLDAEKELLSRHPAIGTLPYNAMNEGSSERIISIVKVHCAKLSALRQVFS